mmetsp:Transcript_25393/g.35437  ORF Transcript_25393/g.35437 Transcript_25393/m.35437 type:complete len:217 (+) Transcript_25393:145-795(+)|eukprot:CAMPEP_0185258464 /NCGR_PEP_ID=MMETSP1359-20130426/7385_1 /TAXON_ID=552665 /ORGANISM="Bigelowiella longifila, Strain CCMP242" /LENGTH=216 /DNA_ID=CAMNT_0027843969 /DNA_START=126 /DNA_END=776 /DNA_ORIENTATION=+
MSEGKRLFEPDKIKGKDKYKTWDDDRVLGVDAPDLSKMEYLTDAKDYAHHTEDKILVLFVWAQFQKACYPKIDLYSKLAEAYGDKLIVVGLSTDPDTSYAKKWIEDPKKKYSAVHPTKFAIAFDKDGAIKKYLMMKMLAPLSVPHCFVIKDKKVVWHQQHSELGATAPQYMSVMEDQLNLLLEGKPVKSVFGENPVKPAEDEDEDEDEEEDDDDDE